MSLIKKFRLKKGLSCSLAVTSTVVHVLSYSNVRVLAKENEKDVLSMLEIMYKPILDFVLKSKENILDFWDFVLSLFSFEKKEEVEKLDFKKIAKYMVRVSNLSSKSFGMIYMEKFGVDNVSLGFAREGIFRDLYGIKNVLVNKEESKIKGIMENVSFTESNDSGIIECTLERKKGEISKIRSLKFMVNEDGVLCIYSPGAEKYLPICLLSFETAVVSGKMSVLVDKESKMWSYLDPFSIIEIFFRPSLYYSEKDDIKMALKRLLEVFEQSDKTGKLINVAKESIDVFDSLDLCFKKFWVENNLKNEDNTWIFEEVVYGKRMLEIIFSKNPPEGCKSENFEKLKKLVIKYLQFIDAFSKDNGTDLKESDFYVDKSPCILQNN